MDKKRNIRKNNLISLALGVVVLVLVNIISSFVFTRFDLTSEKRYSLSGATKKLLRSLDDVVYFKVYLEGEFPAGFKRLHNETMEMLNEFRAYSKNIEYEFIDPSADPDQKNRNSLFKQLVNKGLQPTDLKVKDKEGSSRKIIFPGALVTYKSRELPVHLLTTQIGIPPEEVLNHSVQALEFKLANVIEQLIHTKPKIAFIEGHGELSAVRTYDIMNALTDYYDPERVRLDGKLGSLAIRTADEKDTNKIIITNKYKAVVIAKPDSAFSEKDKFILDQYIMRGGKVLWLVDPVFASMDSLQKFTQTMGIINRLNIEDQLFKYGVRLNPDLLMDLNALPIPVKTGQIGDQPQFEYLPWYYFPVVTPTSSHPIVSNLNAIKFEFVSSLDTVEVPGITKTILLKTSQYSREVNAPVFISLEILKKKPDERLYSTPGWPVAVLLEGEFSSLFRNRIPPEIAQSKEIGFRETGKPTRMIVVSDGDVIANQLHYSKGYPLPLGYDQFTGQTFGNKDFILNAINYLCDDSGLMSLRSRELKVRLLDRTRIDNNKFFWQVLNIMLPVILVVAFGFVQFWLRKRKFSR